MSRLVHISIDTTVKSVSITDSDSVSGEVFLDYNGKMGQPLTFNRASDIPYNDPTCAIRFVTDNGTTGYFTFDDVADVVVNGISIGPSTIEDIINGIGAYLFTSIGGAPAPPASATMIFSFGLGMQNAMFQRMSMQGTVTAINTNNISVYKVYHNDVEKSGSLPFTFLPGDRFFVECSRTDPATAASIDFVTDGISNPIIFNSTTYYKPRTTHFVENMTTTQNYVDGIGLKATGVSSTYLTNSILSNPLKGQFVAMIRPLTPQANGNNFHFGLNDLSRSNTYVPRYFRQQYMFGIYGGNLRVFELGVSKLNIAVNFQDINFYKMESTYTSPGVYTIRYYYSTNGGTTWTLAYTSLATHNGNVNYHLDQMYTNGYYLEHQLAELTQN